MSPQVASPEPEPEPAELGNRRSEDRAATMFRPILIEIGAFAGFCLVRNLSTRGLKGSVYADFAHGERVMVRFGCDLVIEGGVIWSGEGQIGVQFDQPIDVTAVLADLARPARRGRVSRAPRLPIACDGELAIADRTLAIGVEDISQRGIKAQTTYVRPGDEVTVRLDGLAPRKAVVRWTSPGSAGLAFMRPFGFAELAGWASEHLCGRPDDAHAGKPSAVNG